MHVAPVDSSHHSLQAAMQKQAAGRRRDADLARACRFFRQGLSRRPSVGAPKSGVRAGANDAGAKAGATAKPRGEGDGIADAAGSRMLASLVILADIVSTLTSAGYLPIGGHDGVSVYQRPNAALIDLAAVGEFDAPPAEVQAALLDYDAAARISARIAESRVVGRRDGELLVYQHLKLPVISDRDYTLRVSFVEGTARGLRFRIDGGAGPGPVANRVRMSILNGRWDLEPLAGGRRTRAVYHVQLDFAGDVPRWMVRSGAARDLPDLYLGVARLIRDRPGVNFTRR
jgi:hypothetical protein